MGTSETRNARLAATAVGTAPAVMLAGLLAHPPILGRLPDAAAVAEAVAGGTTRWGIAHLTVAVGSGLMILAFLAIRSYLREAGEDRFSVFGLPFVVLGGALYAVLTGLEFAPLVSAETGADVQAAQVALQGWLVPILLAATLLSAVGVVAFARAVADARVLGRRLTGLVVGALLVLAVARAVPVGAVQFYVQGAAGLVAMWPLAYAIWRQPAPQPAAHARPVAAA